MDVGEYLLGYDIKPSVQRMAVMEYLLTHKTHPTVDEIYHVLSPSMPTLSKTTVYNTLKLFSEKGAALCLTIEDKNARFDGDVSEHAHFICMECGHVYDLPLTHKQASALVQNETELNIEIKEVQVYYKGYCKSCKKHRDNKHH